MPSGLAGAVLDIDLEAIAANWLSLKSRLKPGAACAAVVKADAYGLGAARVAPRLEAAGCRHFFVATADEALALRPLLPASALYVLAGVDDRSAGPLAEASILPVLNHAGQIEAWAREAKRRGHVLPAALHLDSGMNRLGLAREEVSRLAAEPLPFDGLAIRVLMSHLVSSEVSGNPLNERQRLRFEEAAARLMPRLGQPQLSFANSSGIFLGPAYHYDLARPGVALYGVNPTPDAPNPMAEVVRLTAKILQVRRVDRGETVGYGATARLTRPSRVAVIPIGYADGLPRSASNRASARIGGISVPVIGRVSMDLITLDVTDVPDALAVPGATVSLIGDGQSIEALAEAAGTIPYEILTSLGARYERRYHEATP
ncbi:MAG: alanine racemase [Alphaproteobacteria bacterium]|nr:alanine racemase [Alphaproteobacteria bacterium]